MKVIGLAFILLLSWSSLADEKRPPAEYPYPESEAPYPENTVYSPQVEQPVARDGRGAYIYDTENTKKSKPYSGIEQPYEVGADGSYYYKTRRFKKTDQVNSYQGVEAPKQQDTEGGYYYKAQRKSQPKPNRYQPKPSKIKEDGTYFYNIAKKETTNTLFIRAGTLGAPDIKSTRENGRNFSDIYSGSSSFLFTVEYDWSLYRGLFLKLGSGISSVTGQGQFASNPDLETKESFTFYMFPNTLSLSYKFRLWDIQYLTPYVEGGPGYFTFIENRSDGEKTKFGGAPVVTASLGLLISLTKFTSGTTLYSDYGITQSWFDIHYRQVVGLDERKDFSSNIITGGFAVGF